MNPKRYESGMQYCRCGKSGVLLPKVSLGMWHNFGNLTPYETSREIVLRAFDNGITHFDLANNYGPELGEAERRMGRILKEDLKAYRDELFISTKAAYDMWEGPYGSWASRKHLTASLDQSLRRMGLDYVDLFYCHRYDPETPLEETLQCLVDIVRSGKALYVGISRWPLHALKVAEAYLREHDVRLLIYQGRFHLLDRAPLEEGILELLQQTGTGFISFSPLAQGLLTDRYLNGIPSDSRMMEGRFLKREVLTETLLMKLHALNNVAHERGETLAQMSLAWVLHHPATTSVLVGVSNTEQLEQNIRCLQSPAFSEEQLRRIEEILA
ncbi:MAG: aldo/keto reductase [Bacteroidaceae bacterium]|nr:aldo/keto reductase [Bacteroidaceae bacterium]